jgi:hypothetical protein
MFGFDPMFWLNLAAAGIWSQVWHWGLGIGLIILCLAGAYFTTAIPLIGPYLKDARKDLLWAAGLIAIFLAGQALGAHDEARKATAKQKVVEQHVDSVVQKTTTPRYRKMKDRWDNPEN